MQGKQSLVVPGEFAALLTFIKGDRFAVPETDNSVNTASKCRARRTPAYDHFYLPLSRPFFSDDRHGNLSSLVGSNMSLRA
jgi:hypothetical protein